MSYAIDFGTSNTVIARWNTITQQAESLKLKALSGQISPNPPLIPSWVYVNNAALNQVWVGQEVGDRGLDVRGDQRFFRSFKRGIGSKIQGFLPELDEVPISFEQVGTWFLDRLVQELEQEEGQKIDSLALTVPVDSFEAYRHWLSQRCQAWGIERVSLLDEPTAVALGYEATQADILLVVDFGGGTIDLSLVQLNKSQKSGSPQGFLLKWGDRLMGNSSGQRAKLAQVIAKAGCNLGGMDLDHWIQDYFTQTQDLPSSSLTTRLAERLKIELSREESATEVYFDDQSFETWELTLDRAGLTEILQKNQLFEQLDALMNQVLQQGRRSGISPESIDQVLLVGGTSQIPAIQTWLQSYFAPSKIRSDRPFEAVALGALKLFQGQEIQDFLYHSYGIRYWNRRQNCHSWHPIIKAGQGYPMPQPLELTLGASLENQPSIELIIGELGSSLGATEVYFEGDRLVTRSLGNEEFTVQPLNDRKGARTIAQLDPAGFPGRDRIKVQFWIDAQRFLRISVEDILLQKNLLENQIVAQLS